MKQQSIRVLSGLAVMAAGASFAHATYSNNFNTDDSANWNIVSTTTSAGVATSDALFGYDYSALGIPRAPHTPDADTTTTGLRIRADYSGTANALVGALSMSPKNQSFTTPYTVKVDVWGNYIGGTSINVSGSNGTNSPLVGVGTAGSTTSVTTPNANDGVFVGSIHDGGTTNTDYRIYTNATRRTEAQYYTASAYANTSYLDNTSPYYAGLFPAHPAPGTESSTYSTTQGGNTPVGVIGFAWHEFAVTNDGTTISWFIDGNSIASVPVSLATLGGTNISLGAFDSNTSSSSGNGQILNFDLFDNLSVTDGVAYTYVAPEPATLSAVAGLGGLILRRRRSR